MKTRILIVEDDQPILTFLTELLQDNGYIVESTTHGTRAVELIRSNLPDLVILDLTLPDIQGEDILKNIKSSYPDLPIIILTAKASPEDTATGLNIGADDYLGKPFSENELLARIHARLRTNGVTILKFENIILDNSARVVTVDNDPLELTKNEFDLLSYLLSNQGKVVTRENILDRVWGYASDIESRVIDVYVGYLRKKLGVHGKLIHTVRGIGYTIRT